jgi:hypothetical protein
VIELQADRLSALLLPGEPQIAELARSGELANVDGAGLSFWSGVTLIDTRPECFWSAIRLAWPPPSVRFARNATCSSKTDSGCSGGGLSPGTTLIATGTASDRNSASGFLGSGIVEATSVTLARSPAGAPKGNCSGSSKSTCSGGTVALGARSFAGRPTSVTAIG